VYASLAAFRRCVEVLHDAFAQLHIVADMHSITKLHVIIELYTKAEDHSTTDRHSVCNHRVIGDSDHLSEMHLYRGSRGSR
jgi:hypothetical protein